VIIVLAWIGVGYRLFDLQGASAEAYASKGVDQRLRHEELPAWRGTIFDRNSHELAVTVDAVSVYVDPREISDPAAVAAVLAPLVDGAVDELTDRLDRDGSFVYITRRMEREAAARVAAAALPGVHFLDEPKRVYPAGELAAQVLGFVQFDTNEGLEGLELQYQSVLSGTPGELIVERDPYGQPIPQGAYMISPAEPGADLILTIDREIQYAAQQALTEAVAATGSEGGAVVVLVPATGDVLAMANVPTFNPNEKTESDRPAFRNRSVTDVYEPGSTQKLITVAAAIDAGVVVPSDLFPIPRELVIDDKSYTDVGRHPAELTVHDIVAFSSNIGTILIQRELGDERFHEYLVRFGLGAATGVDFPGEADGVLRPADEWCATTCGASTAIGYRVSVSALQMAAAYAAIGNDGVWVQPHVVDEIVDGAGSRRPVAPQERRVVSSDTASHMLAMLEGVVEKGTGRRAAIDGYRVGGKTGTTEKYLVAQGAYGDDVVASFIGMAPIENPEIVVAVILDAPAGGEYGGQVAAPVFAQIMEATLHQLGVPPHAP
jgi:cell division protein FtsI (penicillin-binding protein 3)